MSPDWEKTDLQTIQPVTFHFQKPCLNICLNLSHVKDWSKFLCKKNVVVGGGGGGGGGGAISREKMILLQKRNLAKNVSWVLGKAKPMHYF